MNSKGHLYISSIKSFIRMLFCIIATINNSVFTLALGLLFAEVLGIIEELVDHR